MTYWLELIRRALLGTDATAFPAMAAFSNTQLLLILAGLAVALGGLAAVAFRYFDGVAREKGMIDAQSDF
jgi:ABC-2 type transport system permease protein